MESSILCDMNSKKCRVTDDEVERAIGDGAMRVGRQNTSKLGLYHEVRKTGAQCMYSIADMLHSSSRIYGPPPSPPFGCGTPLSSKLRCACKSLNTVGSTVVGGAESIVYPVSNASEPMSKTKRTWKSTFPP